MQAKSSPLKLHSEAEIVTAVLCADQSSLCQQAQSQAILGKITLPDVPSPSVRPLMCGVSLPFATAGLLVLTPTLAAGIFLDVPQSELNCLCRSTYSVQAFCKSGEHISD